MQDINDNAPIFYPRNYSKNIQDSTQPQSEIITVHATDEDSGAFGRVIYSIISGNSDNNFQINPETGMQVYFTFMQRIHNTFSRH